MNAISTFAFTKGNIGKFFYTATGALSSKQAGLVKTLGDSFQHSAEAVLEAGTPAEIAGPMIHGFIGAYNNAVAYATHGWNAQ